MKPARIRSGFCVLLLGSAFVLPIWADERQTVRRIEKIERDAISKDSTTAGMINAAEQAYDAWNREQNRYYQILMHKLPLAQRQALKAAQISWGSFRDQEFKHIESLYSLLEGTMYLPMRVESRIRIVRDRALELLHDSELAADIDSGLREPEQSLSPAIRRR